MKKARQLEQINASLVILGYLDLVGILMKDEVTIP